MAFRYPQVPAPIVAEPVRTASVCSTWQMTPRPEVAVGAVCVRDGTLLLIRRLRRVAIGSWSLPGGRVEAGELLADAVVRELYEETALQGTVTGLCGIAERVLDVAHYVILDYWVEAREGEPVAGDDAGEVVWADRALLGELDLVPRLLEFLDEHGVTDLLR